MTKWKAVWVSRIYTGRVIKFSIPANRSVFRVMSESSTPKRILVKDRGYCLYTEYPLKWITL